MRPECVVLRKEVRGPGAGIYTAEGDDACLLLKRKAVYQHPIGEALPINKSLILARQFRRRRIYPNASSAHLKETTIEERPIDSTGPTNANRPRQGAY